MTRQAFVRVLLSFLLLVSQQMAAAHVLSHLGGNAGRTAAVQSGEGGTDLSSALAQHQSCTQCLAFAQLAGPIGSSPVSFNVPVQASEEFSAASAPLVFPRIIPAFQSRGPPYLS